MHNRSNLLKVEKIICLKHTTKDRYVKNAIVGLSHSGEYNNEAVECLKGCYDLIHYTYVQIIVDAPPLKKGSGKELRQLHSTMQQH